MGYKYLFEPRAAEEYENAFLWYEERSEIAADNFILDIEEALQRICDDPFRYRKTHRKLRGLSLLKYPYLIIYHIDELQKTVSIISLFHHKRNPVKKYRKK